MDPRITKLTVARNNWGAKTVVVNEHVVDIKPLDYKVKLRTQGGELLLSNFEGEDFVNDWLKDYCCDITEEEAREHKLINPIFLMRGADDVWYTLCLPVSEQYLFSSSYGGDGIKIKVARYDRPC